MVVVVVLVTMELAVLVSVCIGGGVMGTLLEMKIGDQCWGLGRRGLGLVGYHGAS